MKWICVLEKHLQNRVTCFVICRCDAFFFFDLSALVCPTESNFVTRLFQVGHLDRFLLGHRRDNCSFVDDGCKIRTRKHRSSSCQTFQIDIASHLDLLRVDSKNLAATEHIWKGNGNLSIESTGSCQRRVKHIWTICCGDHDDLIIRLEPIHLDENGIESLFAFIMST